MRREVATIYYSLSLLARSETLFIIDDITVEEGLDKHMQSPLELDISGRHRSHYLWLFMESCLRNLIQKYPNV